MKSVHAAYEKSPFATSSVLPQSALTVLRELPRDPSRNVTHGMEHVTAIGPSGSPRGPHLPTHLPIYPSVYYAIHAPPLR